jgi:hypothetical protein
MPTGFTGQYNFKGAIPLPGSPALTPTYAAVATRSGAVDITGYVDAGVTGVPGAPTLSAVTSGALALATYYVRITNVTNFGESLPTAEQSQACTANQVVKVVPPAAPTTGYPSIGYNVYVSTTTGTETLQNSSPIAYGTPWQEPNTGLVVGVALPTQDTTGGRVTPLKNFAYANADGSTETFYTGMPRFVNAGVRALLVTAGLVS